jgi:hypothetical protein
MTSTTWLRRPRRLSNCLATLMIVSQQRRSRAPEEVKLTDKGVRFAPMPNLGSSADR